MLKQPLPQKSLPAFACLLLAGTLLCGCQATREMYYDAWEKLGYAKRDRLVSDVKSARDSQTEAKQQFTSALDEFKSVVHFQGGDLEAMYNKLETQYKACSDRADTVKSRIATVKHVGEALFGEWKGEIGQMKDDATLQQKSQSLYDQTHQNYDQMVSRMDTAASKMDPVLTKFHNRVLFIKANLNAAAIGSLQGEETAMSGDVDGLVKDMQASIDEADSFIAKTSAK